jgi:UDP:flavonoid glycosyltransferase YjiC (YdhE family)
MAKHAFDLILLGDYRLYGGTTTSAADEVRTLHEAGYRVGLVQVNSHISGKIRPPLPEIQRLVDSGAASLLTKDDKVKTKLLAVHNARILEQPKQIFPEITADKKVIVIHRAPLDGHSKVIFDSHGVNAIATSLFGEGFEWLPISPVCRYNMAQTHFDLPLGNEDWPNIVFVDDWGDVNRSMPMNGRPIIGRHSRAELEKYPDNAAAVLKVYPDDPRFDVRMLGVDHRLVHMLGGKLPENWTTWGFNQITPRALLEQIDHYVYFHHSEWFETFGRNIAEALSSGAVVYLPRYLERTFGEAALYAEPGEVADMVEMMAQDRKAFRVQSRRGRRMIGKMYGPANFVRMIKRQIGAPEICTRHVNGFMVNTMVDSRPATERNITNPHFVEADVAVVANFCARNETAWRIANETKIQVKANLKTVFAHIPCNHMPTLGTINPMVDSCVQEGLAQPIDPQQIMVKARLVIVHDADYILSTMPNPTPRILADKTVVVLDRSPFDDATKFNYQQRHSMLKSLFGDDVVWAATSEGLRQALIKDGKVPVADFVWTPSVHEGGCHAHDTIKRPVPTVGMLVNDEGEKSDAPAKQAMRILPAAGKAVIKMLHFGKATLGATGKRADWQMLHESEISPLKVITSLDVLLHFPTRDNAPVAVYALIWAMMRGKLVMTSNKMRPLLGEAALYLDPSKIADVISLAWDDEDGLAMQRSNSIATSRRLFGGYVHLGRLQRLMAPARSLGLAPATQPLRPKKRVLFMTSNGTGLGHVTRLLSVARRLDADQIESIFISLSQAIEPIQRAGYAVEYVVSPIYADVDGKHWNKWFAIRMRQLIEHYRPEAVVFDGSSTYEGLNEAIATDTETKLIWIRRGMWRKEQDNAAIIERQKFYDLIIEPADIADARDNGETSQWQHFVTKVDPIRMFDNDELLSRDDACAKLGLDPSKPACLVQLGSGANRDIVSMIDDTLAACAKHPDLQVVVAEWLISNRQIDLWPGIKRLRGYPMSPYFAAFDFTVSAAGYNSFNEIISFGLPAIFVANQNPTMDDQDGRSRFAQDMGAAFHVDETDTPHIGAYIDAIMQDRVRDMLRMNMARIARNNGAQASAALISSAIGV